MNAPRKIQIVNPAPPEFHSGNKTTSLRWAELLGELGCEVTIVRSWDGVPVDLLVTLHAKKSFDSVARFHAAHPNAPIVVALTGTDLYGDIHRDEEAQRALDLATRLIVLQPLGLEELDPVARAKARPIVQSARPPAGSITAVEDAFVVCVLAHLRPVKDPFRAAMAVRALPAESKIAVVHLGAALDEELGRHARAEMLANPRYRWLGEMPRSAALRILAGSKLLALTSEAEGGANVVTEAIAAKVPVISSEIEGSIGLLGDDYPGYFAPGDTEGLARLLLRAENDADFYKELQRRVEALGPLVDPARERDAWKNLLVELFGAG